MGEINYDPAIDRIKNRVGNFVYTTWKGKNIIKKYNGDSRKPSELQVEIQRAWGGLESGTDYFVYCVFTDRPIDEAIRMTESIGNRVTVH